MPPVAGAVSNKCWAAVEKYDGKSSAPQYFSGTATGVNSKTSPTAVGRIPQDGPIK